MNTLSLKRLAGLFILLIGVQSCAPIDQRTFDSNAGKPPKINTAPLPHPASGKPPFLEIMSGTNERDYAPVLERAVKLALTRKTNILFIVQGIAPMQKTPNQQEDILHTLTQHMTTPISEHIIAAGARPIQLDIRALTDPSVAQSMVRIYVQ